MPLRRGNRRQDEPSAPRQVRAALAAGLGINRVARMVGTGNATVAAIAKEMRNVDAKAALV